MNTVLAPQVQAEMTELLKDLRLGGCSTNPRSQHADVEAELCSLDERMASQVGAVRRGGGEGRQRGKCCVAGQEGEAQQHSWGGEGCAAGMRGVCRREAR